MPWMSLMRTGKMKRQSYTISTCICPDCGLKFPISRKKAEAREKGHHKYIWCPNCKERKILKNTDAMIMSPIFMNAKKEECNMSEK